MATADSPSSSCRCPLCDGELLFTKTLEDESEVRGYNKLLAHVRGEGLPEDHQNRAAWAYAAMRDNEDSGSSIAAVVKEVRVGSTVCRVCYRADVEGTIAAWREHGCSDSDLAVLQSLPRYWTLVVEAAAAATNKQASSPRRTNPLRILVMALHQFWRCNE